MLKWRVFVLLAILFQNLLLTGCMGGSVAQQIARSVTTQGADKATGYVVDAQLQKEMEQNNFLADTPPNPYRIAFMNAQFVTLPAESEPEPTPDPVASAKPIVSRLATVEVWGTVVGEEKRLALERIQSQNLDIPTKLDARQSWQLVEGCIQGKKDNALLFLVPPDVGKLKSGDLAIVELAAVGEFNVARQRIE
jgi:hypothetical protein